MSETVAVTETVRDAWQGLGHVVPTADKRAFLQALLDAGFRSIDIGSFVNPRLVPTMADTGVLLDGLVVPEGVSLMALAANARGLEQLLEVARIDEVLFPFSLSERFQQRNTNRTREQALEQVTEMAARCRDAGRSLYVTVSMAFGNNEGEAFDPLELAGWMGRLEDAGADRLGLADTTAQASPELLASVFEVVAREHGGPVPAVHLHVTESNQAALVDAALDAGCRWFDAALGGLGGCQFARGAVSNVSTLGLARQLAERGFASDLPGPALPELDARARSLAR